MTNMRKPLRRVTLQPYKHYNRLIVVTLFADTIALRLKGTRKSYSISVAALMDTLGRREAEWNMRQKKRKKKTLVKW